MQEANKVFTPSTPAKLTFVERESLNNQIVNSLKTPGKQLVVFGHSGCGKTTLIINKLYQLYEDHITVRCISSTTYEEIILQAFDELNCYYSDQRSSEKEINVSSKLIADYKIIKAEIGLSKSQAISESLKRIIPPTLTIQTLARLLGAAKCCLVLEDFHKIMSTEKSKLSQTMKLFMDMAVEFPELKIICIGAVDSGREVIQYDSELKNRVSEIFVPLMTDEEILEIINKGFPLLNIKIPSFISNKIVKISNGVPSICHSICLNICFSMEIYATSEIELSVSNDHFIKAIDSFINDSNDSIKADFEKALIQKKGVYHNALLIFKALSSFGDNGAEHNEILLQIQKEESHYPPGNLSSYLKSLSGVEKGSIIQKRGNKYFFRSPIYLTYAQCLFNSKLSEDVTVDSIEFDLKLVKEKIEYLQRKAN